MSDETEQNQGLQGAHTPPEISPERAAKVGSMAAMTETVMAGLAQSLAGEREEPEQQSLLLADPDGEHCLFGGPVKHVASIMDAAKRARGRPKGSQNRRSTDLANYLLSMGYRDPALNLADLANANPAALAVELACLPNADGATPEQLMADALKDGKLDRELVFKMMSKAYDMIEDANSELMPFFHAKKPQQVEVKTQALGVMLIGEMPSERPAADATLNLTRVDAPDKQNQ
ncbi:hypothetical protein EYD00_07210 [Agrobacterium sp. 33MFTa1.1]|uniref:hypothetical protein n=1 Tax=Agrobacterium sp. 33MFTa1.1 TaxID=1279031 RepID=UPI000B03121B|nr:hypothetical protein [Agrobacterium sp. 33MFTa1.1]QBJ13195.1 hypothetical protein EYD00_07210 [Agrobacterium sp. 33MFTa1.1]